MKREIYIPFIILLVMIAVFFLVSLNLRSVILFIPGAIISFLFYLKTCYVKNPDPERILPIYLFALGIQFIHFTEEYITGFTIELPKLLGQMEYDIQYWLIFNMMAYVIFIMGGIILLKKIKELMIIPLFFISVGVLLNSIGYIMLSLFRGRYFSGLYSALIYLIVGPILINRILIDSKTLIHRV